MSDQVETHTLEYTDQSLRSLEKHVESNRRHGKRSMLDFLDYQYGLLSDEDKVRWRDMFEILKRRVHNEFSAMEQSVVTGLRLWLRGGDIPPFGIPDWDNRPVSHRANGSDRRPHPQR